MICFSKDDLKAFEVDANNTFEEGKGVKAKDVDGTFKSDCKTIDDFNDFEESQEIKNMDI